MKKYLAIWLLLFGNICLGQTKEGIHYSSPSVQLSADVHFQYAYFVSYSIYVGQPFSFKATNVGVKRIRITFDLVALTICGNEVKESFDIALDVKESKGFGNAFFDNDYIASVTNADCADKKPVTYTYKGKSLNGVNKISSVYVKNLVVDPLPEKVATIANYTAGDQLSDDEKLNEALIKKLQKDFIADQNRKKDNVVPKTAVTQSGTAVAPEPNTVVNQKTGAASKEPLAKNDSKNAANKNNEEYKKKVVSLLNNYSFEYAHTEVTVNYPYQTKVRVKYKYTYSNCHWEGNTFIFNKTETTFNDGKQTFSNTFEHKVNLDNCTQITNLNEFNGNAQNNSAAKTFYTCEYDKIVWSIKDPQQNTSWFFESDNKPFALSVKEAFDHIITNK